MKKEKPDRDVINVQGLVRNVLGAVGNTNAAGNTNRLPTSTTPSASPFQIYDETTDSRTPRVRSISKGSFSTRSSPATPDDLIAQTQALSMKGKSSTERPDFLRAPSVVSAVSSAATSNVGAAMATVNTENDANILHQMLGNLETVMSITEQRKGSYHASSPQPVYRGGPNKWVTRYVDYTSKYGLGFLMNDGRYVALFASIDNHPLHRCQHTYISLIFVLCIQCLLPSVLEFTLMTQQKPCWNVMARLFNILNEEKRRKRNRRETARH